MSEARWCDRGNHAFSVDEPGHEMFQGTKVLVDDNGKKYTQHFQADACGRHESFPSQVPALEAPKAKGKAKVKPEGVQFPGLVDMDD